jgi:hypothetical protein
VFCVLKHNLCLLCWPLFADLSKFGHENNVPCLCACINLKLELRHWFLACIFSVKLLKIKKAWKLQLSCF